MYRDSSINAYLAHGAYLFPDHPVCPKCHHRCHAHGSYTRSLRVEGDHLALTIWRVLCLGCRATHAILPHFLVPYSRYPAAAHEAVVADREAGVPLEEAGCEFGQSVETSKRWLMAFRKRINSALGALRGALGKSGQYDWKEEPSCYAELRRLCVALCSALSLPADVCRCGVFAVANLLLSMEASGCWF
jgi:hypothetical protein